MIRYNYTEGCMEEMIEGDYVRYYEAEEWRSRAGRLTDNIILLNEEKVNV